MNKQVEQIEYCVSNLCILTKNLRYTTKFPTQIYRIASELHKIELRSLLLNFNPNPLQSLPERWKELRAKLEHSIHVTKDIERNKDLILGIENNIKSIESTIQ